jgi:hypothetical protein
MKPLLALSTSLGDQSVLRSKADAWPDAVASWYIEPATTPTLVIPTEPQSLDELPIARLRRSHCQPPPERVRLLQVDASVIAARLPAIATDGRPLAAYRLNVSVGYCSVTSD